MKRYQFHINVQKIKQMMRSAGLPLMEGESHITPLFVGDPKICKQASDMLLTKFGIYVQPINYPTVPRGTERLRITCAPVHTDQHMNHLITSLIAVCNELGIPLSKVSNEFNEQGKYDITAVEQIAAVPLMKEKCPIHAH
jgi:5-aminolevulinate synthase